MDPGRAAMIASGGARGADRRDFTSPRRDSRNRVSKPAPSPRRPNYAPGDASRQLTKSNNNANNKSNSSNDASSYMTEEQLSERFVAEEDKFVLRQSKKKADIRVRERRAKPIDFLAFNLRFIDEDRDVFDDEPGDVLIDVPGPERVLESARDWQLGELEADIKSFRTLEKHAQSRDYWEALLVLCADSREQRGLGDGVGAYPHRQHEERLIGSVAADIDGILRPKSLVQLEALEKQITAKLQRAADEPIDTDYWEQLLKRLRVWKAKATLSTINEAVRAARLALLRKQFPEKAQALEPGRGGGGGSGGSDGKPETQKTTSHNGDAEPNTHSDGGDAPQPAAVGVAAENGDTSAQPPPGTARFAAVSNEDFSQATKALYEREVARGVSENEEIFAAEEVVPTTAKPKWADKYRPRKPRYFNRVQMGYEWNKYNQTHYDHDNPPPKVVHGYKFNIFYPELIDKTKAPTYHITREGGRRKGESFAAAGEEDTCLIRFSAGPPYEDIAFRIVDREWDYSSKRERGFKSMFEKVYYRK
ncbi:Cactin, domain protein [Niveomyces insectorum RCEF 264]|uniref:Splicing factor Cactin n=1 Tax=Niveomyces insectorum RCEF 264 TaxID=1081102 RepID=A0A167N8P1_9HYPO|nr:Cactin, domain protein [Niveomyces insectorum RCEF 264]